MRPRAALARVFGTLGLVAMLAIAPVAAGGCYQKTISAKGLGTDGISTEEGNLRKGRDRRPLDYIGDGIFGPVE